VPPRIQREPSIAKRSDAVLLGLSLALCGCAHLESLSPGGPGFRVGIPVGARHERVVSAQTLEGRFSWA